MILGIDPTVDFASKLVLGSPEHPAITLHFINAVLRRDPLITEVEILNPIVGQEFDSAKLSILDVLAKDREGRLFDIEVQRTLSAGLAERLTYYSATQLVGQIGKGDGYRRLRPSIGICILDAILFRGVAELHHDFRLRSSTSQLCLTDCLQIHLLELPKYTPPSDNRVITDPIEQWIYFYRCAKELSFAELTGRLADPVFAEAAGVLEMIARSPQERDFYEARLKVQRDEQARLEAAEERGEARGEARGQLVGRIQLLQQLVGTAESSLEALRDQSLDELVAIERELQQQLRDRG